MRDEEGGYRYYTCEMMVVIDACGMIMVTYFTTWTNAGGVGCYNRVLLVVKNIQDTVLVVVMVVTVHTGGEDEY